LMMLQLIDSFIDAQSDVTAGVRVAGIDDRYGVGLGFGLRQHPVPTIG